MKILLTQRLFIVLSLLLLPVTVVTAKTSRPNILIVIADDLNKDCVGIYGNKDVKTPNIDH